MRYLLLLLCLLLFSGIPAAKAQELVRHTIGAGDITRYNYRNTARLSERLRTAALEGRLQAYEDLLLQSPMSIARLQEKLRECVPIMEFDNEGMEFEDTVCYLKGENDFVHLSLHRLEGGWSLSPAYMAYEELYAKPIYFRLDECKKYLSTEEQAMLQYAMEYMDRGSLQMDSAGLAAISDSLLHHFTAPLQSAVKAGKQKAYKEPEQKELLRGGSLDSALNSYMEAVEMNEAGEEDIFIVKGENIPTGFILLDKWEGRKSGMELQPHTLAVCYCPEYFMDDPILVPMYYVDWKGASARLDKKDRQYLQALSNYTRLLKMDRDAYHIRYRSYE